MPTARRLPSGSWRCQVISHYEYRNGKKTPVRISFTVSDPSDYGKWECERQAADWLLERQDRAKDITVKEAIERYIKAKEGVLSPATVTAYKKYLKNSYKAIEGVSVRRLTREEVQLWVSSFAQGHSPKYVKNVYMLLVPSLEMAGKTIKGITIPMQRKPKTTTPTDEELVSLLDYAASKTNLRNAILLAAFGSLRRSEICALTGEDFEGNKVSVNKDMVQRSDGVYVVKSTKTTGSEREVTLPAFVVDIIAPSSGRVVTCSPDALTTAFRKAVRAAGIDKPFTLHSCRRYYVSISHALQISEQYTMKAGGWASPSVMRKAYRQTLSDVEKREEKKLLDHFESIAHDFAHEAKAAQ